MSSSANLGLSSGALMEREALPAGKVKGLLFRPLHPGTLRGETISRGQRTVLAMNKQPNKETLFLKVSNEIKKHVFGQTESPTHRKHVWTKRNMSWTFFFFWREPTSSSDLTQKTQNYQQRDLSSQRALSADVINHSGTSARRQAWQPHHTPTPPACLWLYWWDRRMATTLFLTFSISPFLLFSFASLLFPLIFCFWEYLLMKNCLSSSIPFIFQTHFH